MTVCSQPMYVEHVKRPIEVDMKAQSSYLGTKALVSKKSSEVSSYRNQILSCVSHDRVILSSIVLLNYNLDVLNYNLFRP